MKKQKAISKKRVKAIPKRKNLPEPKAPGKEDNDFDFGGLPDRDLKKNLGCG